MLERPLLERRVWYLLPVSARENVKLTPAFQKNRTAVATISFSFGKSHCAVNDRLFANNTMFCSARNTQSVLPLNKKQMHEMGCQY